ncbi:hypothetical protein G7Y89_g13178 [Cudoniella acicularis]|uniref:Uncharacterized protein n=1 Tax=Cudoniella acicularis TaxID=354080 RepID=A0A8H4R918_9HELO|nr:hypothetical protein G7Y89_g13178 [Cudoniella acicularis]
MQLTSAFLTTLVSTALAVPSPFHLEIEISESPTTATALGLDIQDVVAFADGKVCLFPCWIVSAECAEGWKNTNTGTEETPCYACCQSAPKGLEIHDIAADGVVGDAEIAFHVDI